MKILKKLSFFIGLLFMTVLFSEVSYADEPDVKHLNVEVSHDDIAVLIKKDSIYYTNSDLKFSLHNADCETEDNEADEVVEEIVGEIDKNEDISFNKKVDYYYGYSMTSSGRFPAYEKLEDSELLLNKEQVNENTAVIFTKIMYVTVYYTDSDGVEQIVGKKKRQYESDVFRIMVDDTLPEMTYTEDKDNICVFAEDNGSGIKKFSILHDEEIIDYIDLSENGRIKNYEHTIAKSVFSGSNDNIEITVRAEDYAGNIADLEVRFTVDVKPPVVEIYGVENNMIYGGDVRVNLRAHDESSLNVWYRCDYIDMDGNESVDECFLNECNSGDYYDNRNYLNEGAYYVRMYGYDSYGNESDIQEISFGIDKSAPEINFEGANFSDIQNGAVNLTVGVKEVFYDGMDVSLKAYRHSGESKIELPMGAYSARAANNKNIYLFDKDGTYSVEARAVDAAKNESFKSIDFTIDRTAPKVAVLFNNDTVRDKAVLNSKPLITINVSDITFTNTNISVALSKCVKGDVYESVMLPDFKMDSESTSFTMPEVDEGEYELNVCAVDGGGNITSKRYQYTLDYSPPIIERIGEFDKKYLKAFLLPENLENDIKDLTNITYKAYLNGKETGPLNIKKDGKYILQVVATDEGGNKAEEMIAFIVDGIKPTVIISGLNEDGMLEKNRAVKFSLNDSDDYFTDIFVNGERILLSDDKKSADWVPDSAGDFRIYVAARDYAGNITAETIDKKCETMLSSKIIDDIETGSLLKDDKVKNDKVKVNPVAMWIACGVVCAITLTLMGVAVANQ